MGRVHRHLRTLAVLWMVYAGLSVLSWLIAVPVLESLFGGGRACLWGSGWQHWTMGHHGSMPWLVPVVTVALIGRAVLYAITGYGLMRQARWGRTLAIVTAAISLIHPPLGTLLGIFTLWVLLPGHSAMEYDSLAVV